MSGFSGRVGTFALVTGLLATFLAAPARAATEAVIHSFGKGQDATFPQGRPDRCPR